MITAPMFSARKSVACASTLWLLGVCVAIRFPHHILDLLFAVGAQIFPEAAPVKTCETAPQVTPYPIFCGLNSSFIGKRGMIGGFA